MTLPQLSKALTSLYNKLGNDWITENLISEPFDFRVYVRRGDETDLTDYVIEVYSDRPIPRSLLYKQGKEESTWAYGVDISVLKHKFKELASYVDTFGSLGKTIGVTFMDLQTKP